MKHSKPASVADSVADLLERERDLIMAGQLEQLARLLPEKERLLGELRETKGDLPALSHMRDIAARNQVLLAAVLRGIRSVKLRLDELKSCRTELKTYTETGQAMHLNGREGRIERKA